jgi:hypothetical protein
VFRIEAADGETDLALGRKGDDWVLARIG